MAATLNGIKWECEITPSTINSAVWLCSFILVRAREQPGELTEWVLFRVHSVHREDHPASYSLKFWKFDVVSHPSTEMENGVWYSDGLGLEPMPYYVERNATEMRPLTIYKSIFERTKRYLLTPSGEQIYEYKVSNPLRIFPPKYINVTQGKDTNGFWHYKMQCSPLASRPPAPAPTPVTASPVAAPPVSSKIPTHVFRVFATAAISAKEECPILMEPLTQTNVCCGPCGHLFSFEGLSQSVRTSGKCPTCRAAIKSEEIQRW